jgi:hypothetical protein
MKKFRVTDQTGGYSRGFQMDFDNGVTVSVQFGDWTRSDKGQTTAEVAVFRDNEWYFADIDDLVLLENGHTDVMTHCSPDVVAWIIDKARHIK